MQDSTHTHTQTCLLAKEAHRLSRQDKVLSAQACQLQQERHPVHRLLVVMASLVAEHGL